MDAGGRVGAPAGAESDLAAFEVPEELVPFLVGGGAVFVVGPQRPAAGDERPVSVDRLLGVDNGDLRYSNCWNALVIGWFGG